MSLLDIGTYYAYFSKIWGYLVVKNESVKEGIFVGDIVKEYPNMIKIVIYHNSYVLPVNSGKRKQKLTSEQRKIESIHRSVRRSKMTIHDIMLSNKFDYWCTFTFNCRTCVPKCDNKPCTCSKSTCYRYNMHHSSRILRNWFRNQKKHSPHFNYLAVPEYHKDGAIHFHVMISGFNGRLRDSGKKTKHNQKIYNATGYYSGFTEFVKIGDRSGDWSLDYQKISNYITKYMTKDMPLIHGRHRFLTSNGLERPESTVNGVTRFGLWDMVKKRDPDFITPVLEVHQCAKSGKLGTARNHQFF